LVQRLYLAKYIVEDVKTIHHDAAIIVEDQNVKKIQKNLSSLLSKFKIVKI